MSAFNSGNWRNAGPREPSGFSQQRAEDPSISEGRRIHLGNLDFQLESADVESFASSLGLQPSKIHMPNPRNPSDRNPGYCFVEFATKEEADQALQQLDGAELSGRNTRASPAAARSTSRQDRSSNNSYASGYNSGYNSNSGYGNRQYQSNQYQGGSPFQGGQQRSDAEQLRKAYVGGLPAQQDAVQCKGDLQELFKDLAPEYVSMPREGKGGLSENNWYCFITFGSEQDAASAIAMNGIEFQGVQLQISSVKSPRNTPGSRDYGHHAGERASNTSDVQNLKSWQ